MRYDHGDLMRVEGMWVQRCCGERPELMDSGAGEYVQYFPCQEPASRRALLRTTPGGDGKLFWLYFCGECYRREGWAEQDLSARRGVHELAHDYVERGRP
jgi:hypothetical protein